MKKKKSFQQESCLRPLTLVLSSWIRAPWSQSTERAPHQGASEGASVSVSSATPLQLQWRRGEGRAEVTSPAAVTAPDTENPDGMSPATVTRTLARQVDRHVYLLFFSLPFVIRLFPSNSERPNLLSRFHNERSLNSRLFYRLPHSSFGLRTQSPTCDGSRAHIF